MNAPNLLPYFNSRGRHLHAILALGTDKAGSETFYLSLKDPNTVDLSESQEYTNAESTYAGSTDAGTENLDILVGLIQEHDTLTKDVKYLCNSFVSDIEERIEQMDIQYLSGLKKFFTTYLETIHLLNQPHPPHPNWPACYTLTFQKSSTELRQLVLGVLMCNQLPLLHEEAKWLSMDDQSRDHIRKLMRTSKRGRQSANKI